VTPGCSEQELEGHQQCPKRERIYSKFKHGDDDKHIVKGGGKDHDVILENDI
jgi:hypothetical protein